MPVRLLPTRIFAASGEKELPAKLTVPRNCSIVYCGVPVAGGGGVGGGGVGAAGGGVAGGCAAGGGAGVCGAGWGDGAGCGAGGGAGAGVGAGACGLSAAAAPTTLACWTGTDRQPAASAVAASNVHNTVRSGIFIGNLLTKSTSHGSQGSNESPAESNLPCIAGQLDIAAAGDGPGDRHRPLPVAEGGVELLVGEEGADVQVETMGGQPEVEAGGIAGAAPRALPGARGVELHVLEVQRPARPVGGDQGAGVGGFGAAV